MAIRRNSKLVVTLVGGSLSLIVYLGLAHQIKVKAISTADCAAGKPYCYSAPVHLNSLINTPGFEGKPSLSSDGRELYFVSDRPGALGGPGDQDIYVSRRSSTEADWGPPERVPPPISSPSSTSRLQFRSMGWRCTLPQIGRFRTVRQTFGFHTVHQLMTTGAKP